MVFLGLGEFINNRFLRKKKTVELDFKGAQLWRSSAMPQNISRRFHNAEKVIVDLAFEMTAKLHVSSLGTGTELS